MRTSWQGPYIQYAHSRLDRAAERRADTAWLDECLGSNSRIIPVWRTKNLVTGAATNPTVAPVRPEAVEKLLAAATETAFLGVDNGTAVFAIDISECHAEQTTFIANGGQFVDLRTVGSLMAREDAALLAYARAILHWHGTHRYCARCGHANESRQGGHVRQCTNASCGHQTYPRTDPAVIMLAERGAQGSETAKCLLGRRAGWPPGVFSTLAGFVEPGESLEQAVAREVFEESGIQVDNIRYQGSQPWPFPSSLMLGFWASAQTLKIQVDQDELEDARWFGVDELEAAGDWGDSGAGLRLPRRDSIARYLIETWLAEQVGA